jgi:hypothetical protein
MRDQGIMSIRSRQPRGSVEASPPLGSGAGTPWTFVYVFFTNGTPFDAPNRSEPCRAS